MRRLRPAALPLLLVAACSAPADPTDDDPATGIAARLARFVPVPITAETGDLPESERTALDHLVEAARLMDPIFLRQAWHGNPELAASLDGDAAALFAVHYGPWDRLDEEPFATDLPRPDTAGFYPAGTTREEFQACADRHPEQRDALTGLHTMIVAAGDGYRAVPYSEFFREWLEPAAAHLRAAADATENESLARFLRSRAAAFEDDDYYQSDMDWMDLDSRVEITIGPYETYEDRLFGYKAAFEAFVTVADPAESARLERYKAELPALERNLPIPDSMKNLQRGTDSPIRVVDVVFTAGDTRAGVQTIAFNLPNDERVREAKGSKKVLLRNVLRAKYDGILEPIARLMLVPGQAAQVTAEAFANQTLFHELAHGLGPGRIMKDGRDTEVRLELKDLYSPLEEAKADVLGVYDQHFMIERGVLDAAVEEALGPTWLAGLFRSIRFGVEEAHGRANMIQFNYMVEHGAVTRDASGRYRVEAERFPAVTRDLVHDILVLQANGDHAGTEAFFARYGELEEPLRADLARLADLPVDIRPIYAVEPAAGRPSR